MNREQFVRSREKSWKEYEGLLVTLEMRRGPLPAIVSTERFPELYRGICQDLALCRHRRYGHELTQSLNRLALRGHEQLYRGRKGVLRPAIRFVTCDFPREVRRDGRLFLLANALFYGPFLGMLLAGWWSPDWIYTLLDENTVAEVEAMYDPGSTRVGAGRESESDVVMFAFYLRNNIGIAFQTFAGGVLGGLGTLFFIVYNGLVLGAISGHINRIGYYETFYPFVIGHGAFELTAIVLAGMAGLKMGFAFLSPGRKSRAQALVEGGHAGVRILCGSAFLLVIAAFIEGFWSPSSAPVVLKLSVGAVLWVSVAAYFLFCGRDRED